MLFDTFLRRGLYFQKTDPGAGGAADPDAEKEDKSAADETTTEDKGKAKKEEKTFTQAELDQKVEERLQRERKKNEVDAEKARKIAEAAALEKNQEWQKLAEERQKEIDTLTKEKADLDPFKEQAEKYKNALDGILAKQKEKLPKHILTLIEKMDPVDAMAYITENAEALGAKPETYSETPEGKEKKVTDDDKKEGQRASSNVINRTF